ncbi:MAG: Bacterial Ig domain, partial [Myxococcaceae bacterium]|nr:Bacterial Ig domain [Myxococcaceae bacterium]
MKRPILLALAALLFAACNQKDTTAPPAPNVDPPVSPTGESKVWITGSAEFGSTVKLTGPNGDGQTTADPFTARFRLQVELKPGTANAFSLTATDAAGNVSEAAAVTIESQPPHAARLVLVPRQREVRAGEQVALDVTMLDQYGNDFLDPAVSFEVTPPLPATANVGGVMKPQGVLPQSQQFVAYELAGVVATGYTFSIKATSGTASAVAQLTVRPAPAVTFSKLSFDPTGTTATVPAGTDVKYLYEVQDAFGNVTTGPVQVFTNAPGAILIDDGITGSGTAARLVSAGSYSLSFYIAGAGLKGTLQLNVGVAAAAAIDVMASTTLLGPNADMQVFARVRDPFGNPIPCATATLADVTFTARSAAGTGVAPTASACFNGAFQATYRFTAEGTYAIDGEYKPGTLTPPVKGTVFVTVLSFDNTPPTVDIPQAQVRRNGQPCAFSGTPASCTVQPGDFIEFTVAANDNKALSELAYTAFFSTAGGTGTLRARNVLIPANAALPFSQYFSFSVPNTTFFEDVNLSALAIDGAGNRATSSQLVLRVNFGTFGGRVATVV